MQPTHHKIDRPQEGSGRLRNEKGDKDGSMPRRKRGLVSKLPFLVRLLYALPLALVLLERLLVPLQLSRSPSPSYFSLEKSKDNEILDNKNIPGLTEVTKNTGDWMRCPSKTRMVQNPVAKHRQGSKSKIPMFIHQTGETKCLAPTLYDTSRAWRKSVGNAHEYWFHDIRAVNRLLNLGYPEFPLLRNVLRRCIKGFGKISLWKYLVLYSYGGVFAALGSVPEQTNFDKSMLADEDAIFFVGSDHSSLMPDFMAVSPRHPLVYYIIHHYLLGVLMTTNTGEADLYRNIDLHAMNAAIADFIGDAGMNSSELEMGKTLLGTDDRTIMLLDHKADTGGIFKSAGEKHVSSMLVLGSKSSSKSHQPNWNESCMSEILSDLG
ncbi:unnamed protein product [Cylindrotheca closterium]|uniref:Uncharacterized protein n=1 Tax=Cylindrotheca closterium TaxID=2856 RepID=A0AAD2FNP9_9STRA|nr:unnamed protein product [Cylindrotheca closterium]